MHIILKEEQKIRAKKINYKFLIIIIWIATFAITTKYINLNSIHFTGIHPIPIIDVVNKKTNFGLKVNTPVTGDACWSAQFPCTPMLNNRLDLWRSQYEILKGRLGFIIREEHINSK
jgi:hypothetical protein